MNVNTEIVVADGSFSIICSGNDLSGGKSKPSIYDATITSQPMIYDNKNALEGELVLRQQSLSESELIEGELILNPENEDADYYSLGGEDNQELLYDNPVDTQDYVTIPVGGSLILILNPMMKGRITNFSNLVINVSSGVVEVEFRILIDGLFLSDWQVVSELSNFSAIDVENNAEIQIRIRNNDETDVTFYDCELYGTINISNFDAPIFNSSVFANLLGTDGQNKLELNLFKKLYFRGILPQYIKRAENRDYNEDKDFVTFFKSVARYYSLILSFFKRWDNFDNDYEMLLEQMKSYGINIDENSVTLEDLQILARNIYSDVQMRGTQQIFKHNAINGKIDGEFLRLTRNRICDELLYDYIPKWKMGWCVGQSSPMYKGTCQSYNLNKTDENDPWFSSLDNYKTNKSASGANITIVDYYSNKRGCLRLTTGSGKKAALGGFFDDELEQDDKIYVSDTQIDYEISFQFLIDDNSRNSSLVFGIEGYDINKKQLKDAFCKPNGTVTEREFINTSVGKFKSGIWYQARAIVHAYSTENVDSIRGNLGFGTDLYFQNPFVKYFLPKIELVSSGAGITNLYLYDYKIRPAIRGRNILPLKNGEVDGRSLGFLQFSRFFYTYFRNNNNTKSLQEVTNIIEKYLYPFDSINLFTITGNKN